MTLVLDDCTPGLLAYIHWDKKYPALYACMSEMAYVDGLVLEFCIHTHDEWKDSLVIDPSTNKMVVNTQTPEQAKTKLDAFAALLARSGALPTDSSEKTS